MKNSSEVHAATRARRTFIALAVATFLVGIATPVGLLIWQANSPSLALLEGAAGTLASTRVDRSVFPADTLTLVDTSTGNVVVKGPFSGTRGSPLAVVQLNKLRNLRLCIVGATTGCAPLAGVWAGRLAPTAAARHAVDFQRYGMSTSDLVRCIGLGVITLAIVALLGTIMLVGGDDDDECTDTEPAA